MAEANKDYDAPQAGVSQTAEKSKRGKAANVPGSGVYRHPETGQTVITQGDPLFGNAQAQAFSRLGFVFDREARSDEIKTITESMADERRAQEDSMKGLAARMEKLESVSAENKALAEEVEALKAKLAEAEAAKTPEKTPEKTDKK